MSRRKTERLPVRLASAKDEDRDLMDLIFFFSSFVFFLDAVFAACIFVRVYRHILVLKKWKRKSLCRVVLCKSLTNKTYAKICSRSSPLSLELKDTVRLLVECGLCL